MQLRLNLQPTVKAVLALSALSCLLAAAPARAAIDMFMNISTINGGTSDPAFAQQKASDVLAWSWGLSATNGVPSFQDLSRTQYMDSAFTGYFSGVATSRTFQTATLSARTAGANPYVFLTLKLTDVQLTSLSTGGSGGEDRFTMNTTLLPLTQIAVSFTPSFGATKQTAVWNLDSGSFSSFRGNLHALDGLAYAGAGSNFTGVATPVPEPQTWLLFGLGIGALAWAQRRLQPAKATANSVA